MSVTIAYSDAGMRAVFSDDGKGFNPALSMNTGSGLFNLTNRARLLKGSMEMHSRPEAGTRIEIHLPIQKLTNEQHNDRSN